MISQFIVLSLRGDTIVSRDYRYDVPPGSAETFFRTLKFGVQGDGEETPPVFHVDGVNYFHLKAGGLLFLATTRRNVAPSVVLELLSRIAAVLKDYCGVLNEETLRKNFILAYELLDEMIDFGCASNTSTEGLKQYIFNEPITAQPASSGVGRGGKSLFSAPTRTAAAATNKSVMAKDKANGMHRDEVFVDIIERISVTFNAQGYPLTSEVDGSIMMKSFLTNNPDVKLALNEDLVLAKAGDVYGGNGGMGVVLDDCNFHTAVRMDDFDLDRTLSLTPPDGEFAVMNYRSTAEFKPPFRVYPTVEEVGPYMVDVIVKLRADFPSTNNATNVTLTLPLPKTTVKASCSLGPAANGQSVDYRESHRQCVWTLKKLAGGSEVTMRCRVTLPEEHSPNVKREMGPISMAFVIPMYNVSRLQVRYLQIMNRGKAYNPYRWVRYITQSSSYACRI